MKVTVKSIPVRYDGERYFKGQEVEIKDAHFNENLFVKGQDAEETDLYTLTEAELKKINKDDIKAFLDTEGIEYDSSANKDELIAIVLGDADDE
ncbi:hypothetical protein MST22_17390 [Virgibacillus halodenitrificans]|uniref:hypothetical protein n=1 Tax=Virgibacillus halodenitrificans TaxID=1482 RepID=UPI001FB2D9BD|nr:hypothetical protein [Virgibacillus halodenitrificans]MCJ0932928.1 hypothetical protein [Virgibacillus halodenitrificans]